MKPRATDLWATPHRIDRFEAEAQSVVSKLQAKWGIANG